MLLRVAFAALFLCGTFLLGALCYLTNHKCIDFATLEHYDPGTPSLVLDDEGNEWARFAFDRREPVVFQNIPEHVIQAFIAAEDHSFFYHRGISIK